MTVHGTSADADRVRVALLAATDPPGMSPGPLVTVAELLPVWLAADHPWKPSTLVGYRSVVRALVADPIAGVRVHAVSPRLLRETTARWQSAGGASIAVAGARVRVLRSAVGWAWNERLIDIHAFRFLRGPGRVPPRRPLSEDQVRQLLATAELRLLEAHANHPPEVGVARGGDRRLHRAEQTCCWSGWPPTPAPAAASSPPYGSTTSTGGCCASTAPSRPGC